MAEGYEWMAVIILLSIIGGLPRILLGPTRADAMLATQLCGTSSVAILVLFAAAKEKPYLNDIALVFSLLAAVATISFVRMTWCAKEEPDGDR